MDTIQITKNSPTTKNKVKPRKRPKIQSKQLKKIGLVCNPVTASSLRNIASIGHASSFLLQIMICLKHCIPNFLNFKTIGDLSQETYSSSNDFGSKLTSLCYHALCTTLLQSDISPSFQLRIAIHLNHWIFLYFLSLKSMYGFP